MTKLLDRALDAARRLSVDEQDDVARLLLQLLGEEAEVVTLSPAERDAIARSKAAADHGDFASEEQVQQVLSKFSQ